ncbi:hypothetical protein ACOSP6_08010 [Tenacibaculum sp. MEBiC06402]|uniref:hypothetical protein n=1 Tax=unclassified Tenacibaculum TaxID=2635139 RepID=UPI003B9B23E5
MKSFSGNEKKYIKNNIKNILSLFQRFNKKYLIFIIYQFLSKRKIRINLLTIF